MDFFSKVNVELEGELKKMSEWLNKLEFPDLVEFGIEQGTKDEYEQYFERKNTSPTPIVETQTLNSFQEGDSSNSRRLQNTEVERSQNQPINVQESKNYFSEGLK